MQGQANARKAEKPNSRLRMWSSKSGKYRKGIH